MILSIKGFRSLLQEKPIVGDPPLAESVREAPKTPFWLGLTPSVLASSLSAQESSTALLTQAPLNSTLADLFQESQQPTTAPKWSTLKYLGQYQKVYLLFEQGKDLLFVDQHAASERILYERLLTQVSTKGAGRQALLAPLIWDVTPDQAGDPAHPSSALKRTGLSARRIRGSEFCAQRMARGASGSQTSQTFSG